MFTTIDKALAALLGVVAYALINYFGVESVVGIDLADADVVNGFISNIVMGITPLLVWLVPNKA